MANLKASSKKYLAEQLEISQANMSNIEFGRCGVTIDHFMILRAIFVCCMNDFFVDVEKSADQPQRGVIQSKIC